MIRSLMGDNRAHKLNEHAEWEDECGTLRSLTIFMLHFLFHFAERIKARDLSESGRLSAHFGETHEWKGTRASTIIRISRVLLYRPVLINDVCFLATAITSYCVHAYYVRRASLKRILIQTLELQHADI